ncbi:MAG: serpin family protein [Limisphaerales bacterium]
MQRFIIVTIALGLVGCDIGAGAAFNPATPIANANNEFTWNFYKQVRRTNENLICSPFSVSYSMGLLYSGARGKTAAEIAQAMLYPTNSVDTSMHDLASSLQRVNTGAGIELQTANAIWASSSIQFLPDFTQTAKRQYDCELHNADFQSHSETVRQEINSWITRQMKGKLQGDIPSGKLDSTSRLVLVNTIYFHGVWNTKFVKSATHERPFYVSEDIAINVPTMFCSGKFRRFKSEICDVLELPYKSGNASMFIVLPALGEDLGRFESALPYNGLINLFKAVEGTDLTVALPRFNLKSDLPLNQPLQELGMHDAFTAAADFSGMDGTKNAYLSSVQQQAFVEVDEEGTTAGAVTQHHVRSKGMTPHFIVDHPFLFVITENSTGTILFIGKVINPAKQ